MRVDPVTLLLDEIAAKVAARGISRSLLEALVAHLRRFADSAPLSRATFPPAGPGQEVLHELGRHPGSGIALYLVSDAPGITSAPYEHLTWAITLGLDGTELNMIYRIRDSVARTVEPVSTITLKAGDWLSLFPDEIHATEATGPTSTYHLHLYGRPLDRLPPFETRRFRVL
jgi:predicted metal-dependent enzyme (double-stranded beta helix superfamily)